MHMGLVGVWRLGQPTGCRRIAYLNPRLAEKRKSAQKFVGNDYENILVIFFAQVKIVSPWVQILQNLQVVRSEHRFGKPPLSRFCYPSPRWGGGGPKAPPVVFRK